MIKIIIHQKKSINIWKLPNKELLYLILSRDGGKTTVKIIDAILERPYNKNQLSNRLELNYKTIEYHLKIMGKYNYITKEEFEHKNYYLPSKKLLNNIDEYNLIKEYIKEK